MGICIQFLRLRRVARHDQEKALGFRRVKKSLNFAPEELLAMDLRSLLAVSGQLVDVA